MNKELPILGLLVFLASGTADIAVAAPAAELETATSFLGQTPERTALPAFRPGARSGGAGAAISKDLGVGRDHCGGVTCVLHWACDSFWCWCLLSPYSACFEAACQLNCPPPV